MPKGQDVTAEPTDPSLGHDKAQVTLYVAGATRSSKVIERITQEASGLSDRVQLSVVDVLEDPARAERDTILTTPMMVRWTPPPVRRLTGDLASVSQLLASTDESRREAPTTAATAPEMMDEAKVSEVIGRTAHELKGPLTVIQGFAVTLVEAISTLDQPTAIKCAEAIVRGSLQLHNVMDSMLVARAVEHGGIRVDLVDFDLGLLTQETVRDLEPLTAQHKVVVDVIGDTVVQADTAKVRQIITNLVSNAVKFSPDGSTITITVAATEEAGHVTVQDQGPGIPPDKLGAIFEQYERLGRTEKGIGLGLYISRQLAIAQGGRLSALSDGANGTLMELVLPRHASPPT